MKIFYNIIIVFLLILCFLIGRNTGINSQNKTEFHKSESPTPSPESEEENGTSNLLSSVELYNNSNNSSNMKLSNILPYGIPTVPVTPSIPLDTETESHLEQFRSQARELNKTSPDAFFISGTHEEKKVALTFDDGPDKHTTPIIMKILNEFDIKATFFVVGQNAEKYPYIIQSLFDSGHQIANHSWSHKRPLSMNVEKLIDEIDKTNAILADILDIPDDTFIYFRPPYGLVTYEQLDALKEHGYKAICWSIDSMDWYTSSAENIKKCVVELAHPGAIILMHSAGGKDQRASTIKALPGIIEELSKQGYEFVTIDELLK